MLVTASIPELTCLPQLPHPAQLSLQSPLFSGTPVGVRVVGVVPTLVVGGLSLVAPVIASLVASVVVSALAASVVVSALAASVVVLVVGVVGLVTWVVCWLPWGCRW